MKTIVDGEKLKAQLRQTNEYLEETQSIQIHYDDKLKAVSAVVLGKIAKAYSLQGEQRRMAEYVVERAIDDAIISLALDKKIGK